jgi:integrase
MREVTGCAPMRSPGHPGHPRAREREFWALVFTTAGGKPWRRQIHSGEWRKLTTKAGLPTVTFHQLRHHYASLLIRYGESIVTVQNRLGHASADETLSTYSHLWPDADERTREAIDQAYAGTLADSLRTEHGN